ncbi:MAG: hypothetical protein AB1304_08915 [Bacteroidota bacterium]
MSRVTEKIIGSIITALAFASFIGYGKYFFEQTFQWIEFLLVFFIGFLGYLYLRLSKLEYVRHITFFAGLIVTVFLIKYDFLSTKNIMLLCLNALIVLLYHNVFRKNIFIKSFIISLVWLLWLYFFTNQWNMFFYLQQFVFVFLLTLPFDINGTDRDKIMTIPKKYGIKIALKIIYLLLAFYFLLGLLLSLTFQITSIVVSLLIAIYLLIPLSFKNYYVYLFYDGIIVLQWIIYWLVKYYY